MGPDQQLFAVAVGPGTSLETGTAQRLFRLPSPWWDVSRDGGRVLTGLPVSDSQPPFTVVLNRVREFGR